MGVIGKVAGTMLKDNLVRNGVDLQIDSNLMYYDVANRRIGINTTLPGNTLTVNGTATISSVYINNSNLTAITGNLVITSLAGNIDVSNKIISYVGTPVGNLDATNKQYVDLVVDAIRYPNLYLGNSDTGNTNVVLNSETLNLVGNTNQINVAITENTATFTLASNLVIGNLNTTNAGQLIGYLTGPIGSNVANTGAFTTATATGNISGANLIASGSGGQVVGYLTGAIGANTANTGSFTTITTTAAGSSTVGQITLNGATSNRIDFAQVGLGDPNTTVRSEGTKIVLWPLVDGNGVDYAIGLTSGVLWNSVHDESRLFRWFANTNSVATLTGTGNFTVGNQLIGYHTGAIGANVANTGIFTSVTTTSGGQLTGYHTGVIGANTANAGTFTTLVADTGNIANFYFSNNSITAVNADGNVNIVPIGNGIVNLNTTTAVQVPVGTTFARPSNPSKGMFRFNSASGALEIYDGFTWNQIGGTQTNIVSSTFTGDGSTLAFTLSQDATTSGTIVSINGVTQIPDSVYTITGNVLTFAEAPVSTDIIEVRILTTTSSVVSLTQGNSTVYFDPANSYAIKADVNGVTKLIVGTANTYISGNLVTTNGITWANGLPYAGGGTVQSITASTTPVSGLSLSGGTITNSGTIAITGTLDLSSPPIIGATAANSATFTALNATGNIGIASVAANVSTEGEIKSGRMMARYNATKGVFFDTNNDGSITSADSLAVARLETGFMSASSSGGQEWYQPAYGSNFGTKKVGVGFHVGTLNEVQSNSVSIPTTSISNNVNAVVLGYMNNGPRILLMDYAISDNQPNTTAYSSTLHRFYGNVGIGVANAAVALDVAGQVRGYFNGPIGANTSNTGAFTTVTASTNMTIGAIQLWAANSTITGVTITGTSAGATGPLNGSLGAAQPNTIVATTIITTSGGQITGYHTGPIGANTANTGVFTSVTTTSAGQITGYLTGAIGANTANTGAFTTITASSTLNVTGTSSFAGTITAATINASTIGNSGASITGTLTGSATSATYVTGLSAANVQGVIGSVSTGSFPTLNQNTTGSAATFTSTSQNSQFNSIGVGTAASATAGEIRATNNVTAYYSDDRLKTRLGNIDNALEKVISLNGFNYQPNDVAQSLGYTVKDEVGVSAQEVQRVLPSAVVPAPIDEKYLTVHYDRLIPLLIEAIKELTAKVERLEGK